MACNLEMIQSLGKLTDVESRIKKYNEIILCKFNNINPQIVISLINELIVDLEKVEFKSTLQSVWDRILGVYKREKIYAGFVKVFVAESLTDDVEFNKCVMGMMRKFLKEGGNEEPLMDFLFKCDKRQLVKVLKHNYKNIPQDVCFKYIHFRIIPQIFSNMDEGIKDELMDLVLVTPIGFAYTYMTSDIIQIFKNNIINKYLPLISTTQNGAWSKYCKLLIHYCGKLLHCEIELTNSILRLVENGFKTKTIPDRVGSYECWKMLIENYNLDPSYLKQPKQIRLLIKPLKAILSRNNVILLKRFEAYTFFIEKAENQSISCLEDYLINCFGPYDDEAKKKMGCAFTELYPKTTEILLKLIGHQKNSPCCKKNTYLPDIYVIKQFLNIENFHKHAELFVSCVRVCSELTIKWTTEEDGDTVINCLWRTIFNLLLRVSDENRTAVVTVIYNNLCISIKKWDNIEKYYDKILRTMLKCMVKYLLQNGLHFDIIIHDKLVFPLILELISYQTNNPNIMSKTLYIDFLDDMLEYCKRNKTFLKNMNSLFKYNTKTCLILTHILLYCIKNINDGFNMENCDEDKEIIMNLFEYSVSHNLTQSSFDWSIACEVHPNTVLPDLKSMLIKKLKTIVQTNPKVFLNTFKMSQVFLDTVTSTEQQIFNDLIFIFCNCFSLPIMVKLNDHVEYKKGMKRAIDIWKKYNFKECEDMYKCFKELLTIQQMYNVLPVLNDFITLLTISQRVKAQEMLYNVITDLTSNKNKEVSKDALKILSRFNSVKTTSATPIQLSRAAKISNMAKTSPKPTESPKSTMVRLFGHDIDTLSPAKLKGSMLEKASTNSSPRASNIMPVFTKKTQDLDSFKDIDFVSIKKEIKLQMNKMNDHQMEMIKKKRDDIPALYQDLSQSVSQSLDISIKKFKENAMLQNSIDEHEVKSTEKAAIALKPKEETLQIENIVLAKDDDETSYTNTSNVSLNSSTDTDTSGIVKTKKRGRPRMSEESKSARIKRQSIEQNTSENKNRKILTPPSNSNVKRRSTRKCKADTNDVAGNEKEEKSDKLEENSSKNQSKENQEDKSDTDDINYEKLSKSAQRALAQLKINMVNGEKLVIPRKRISKRKSFSDDELVEFPNTRKFKNKMSEIKEISEEKEVCSDAPGSNKKKELYILLNGQINNDDVDKDLLKEQKDIIDKQITVAESSKINNKKELEESNCEKLGAEKADQNVNINGEDKQNSLVKEEMDSDNIIEESPPIEITPIKDSYKNAFNKIRVSLFKVETSSPKPENTEIKNDDLLQEKSLLPDTETLDICSEDAKVPLCDMDTESIIMNHESFSVDTKNISESIGDMSSLNLAISDCSANGTLNTSKLVTSPIMNDTPDRNCKLYKDTLHISPIKKVDLDDTTDYIIRNGIHNDNLEEDLPKENDLREKVKTDNCPIVLKAPSIRSAKLLKLLPNPPIQMKTHKTVIESTKTIHISSPKTDRIRKMLLNCGDQNKTEEIVTFEEDELLKINDTDVLKFDREIPSPYAKPKISILKRKMPDTAEEGLSPCAKRKRVNFSDPPTSCQKIYFKELEENTRFRKAKKKSLNAILNVKGKSDSIDSIQNIQIQINNLNDGIVPLSPTKCEEQKKDVCLNEDLVSKNFTESEEQFSIIINEDLVPLISSPIKSEETSNSSFSIISDITVKKATDGSAEDATNTKTLIENIDMAKDDETINLIDDKEILETTHLNKTDIFFKTFLKQCLEILGIKKSLPIIEEVLKTQLHELPEEEKTRYTNLVNNL